MKAQIPAEGIMLTKDFGDSKYYEVACTCGNEDDSIEVCVEIDNDIQELQVTFYTTHLTEWWKRVAYWQIYDIKPFWLYSIVYNIQGYINGFYHRLAVTRDVWFNGYAKYYSCTYMTKQQALNFSQTLVDAIAELEKNKKAKRKSSSN
jgi:hypothetical protein